MPAKTIIIDGYIGPYGYSKQYIRGELSGNSKNQVVIKISSLGGSVDDAINIYDQFVEHGNVTAELSAFVASSATIISLGAKNIRMNEHSFYLIHKAMNWVDEWGRMNEDELEILIAKLENQKQQLAKVTLQLARMYVKKTGKSLEEITGLMKKQSWLTASEALEWGFVDEIFVPEVAENYLDNQKMVAMITSSGYPEPPRKADTLKPLPAGDEESFFSRIYNRLIDQITEIIPKNRQEAMKKQFIHLNRTLNIEQLEGSAEGAYLNEEQMGLIEAALERIEQLETANEAANTEQEDLLSRLERNLVTISKAYEPLNAVDPTIEAAGTAEEKAEAIRALLAARPAGTPIQALGQSDETVPDEVDWDTIDQLPHNKHIDINS